MVAVVFLLVTLAEAGLCLCRRMVVGKKTFRILGFPTARRIIIKYQKPLETDPGRLVTRYNRIPMTYSIYEKFKKRDRLEHYRLSFFFRNDESMNFPLGNRWIITVIVLAFLFFAAFRVWEVSTYPVWATYPIWAKLPVTALRLDFL